uniref:Uncharacterized protein n=1 Tax=Utricularia reniformis TaxID=192314 RepID=A0A1Y0B1R3_9LAMI|nr:hypothetical protein AEK19_MT1172 [Utricularia reniformis]ART31385.1 hypothetical protein AEK19_MT1172 [Utricularia reniformis]
MEVRSIEWNSWAQPKVRALSSEQGRTIKYSRNQVANEKDLLCSEKVMVTQKRSPSKKDESASLPFVCKPALLQGFCSHLHLPMIPIIR